MTDTDGEIISEQGSELVPACISQVEWLATSQDCNSNLVKVSGSAGGGLSLTCNRQKTELVSRLLLLQNIALKFTLFVVGTALTLR